MNKKEFAKNIARRLSVTHSLSYQFVEVMQDVLTEELKKNGYIMIQGFGVFSPWVQNERIGRNPKNGITYLIEQRVSVKFRPGKELLRKLNTSEMRKTEDEM